MKGIEKDEILDLLFKLLEIKDKVENKKNLDEKEINK